MRSVPDRQNTSIVESSLRRAVREVNSMGTIGTVFEPDLIDLMNSALDEAATILPRTKRTAAKKVKLASRILAAAAKGERDPTQLRIAALREIADDQVDPNVALAETSAVFALSRLVPSIDIYRSYWQLQQLRKQVEQAEADDARTASDRRAR
jgi:hypothetical protein